MDTAHRYSSTTCFPPQQQHLAGPANSLAVTDANNTTRVIYTNFYNPVISIASPPSYDNSMMKLYSVNNYHNSATMLPTTVFPATNVSNVNGLVTPFAKNGGNGCVTCDAISDITFQYLTHTDSRSGASQNVATSRPSTDYRSNNITVSPSHLPSNVNLFFGGVYGPDGCWYPQYYIPQQGQPIVPANIDHCFEIPNTVSTFPPPPHHQHQIVPQLALNSFSSIGPVDLTVPPPLISYDAQHRREAGLISVIESIYRPLKGFDMENGRPILLTPKASFRSP